MATATKNDKSDKQPREAKPVSDEALKMATERTGYHKGQKSAVIREMFASGFSRSEIARALTLVHGKDVSYQHVNNVLKQGQPTTVELEEDGIREIEPEPKADGDENDEVTESGQDAVEDKELIKA